LRRREGRGRGLGSGGSAFGRAVGGWPAERWWGGGSVSRALRRPFYGVGMWMWEVKTERLKAGVGGGGKIFSGAGSPEQSSLCFLPQVRHVSPLHFLSWARWYMGWTRRPYVGRTRTSHLLDPHFVGSSCKKMWSDIRLRSPPPPPPPPVLLAKNSLETYRCIPAFIKHFLAEKDCEDCNLFFL
jgi:hypothetical protein